MKVFTFVFFSFTQNIQFIIARCENVFILANHLREKGLLIFVPQKEHV